MPRTGQHHSEEAKEKIRAALIAIHPTRGMEKVDGVWVPRRKRNPRGFISVETRKKMSESQKRRAMLPKPPVSEETRLRMSLAATRPRPYARGRKMSEAARENMRLGHVGKVGDKASRWKGGITPLVRQIRHCPQYRKWREDVFTRDDFVCVFCGIKGCFIEADHYPRSFKSIFHENEIKSLEQAVACEEFWDIGNGRTLCRKCHDTTKKKVKV